MQVSVKHTSNLERQITVQLPEERVATAVQERLQEISRKVRIDGFRPGKAPMAVVQKRFQGSVRSDVLNELVRNTFTEAVSNENLRPAGRPVFNPVSGKAGEGLSYTATFEVYPTVTLGPLKNLAITRYTCEIGERDVDEMVETLRQQRRTFVPVERAAKKGDRVMVDFKGTIDEVAFVGGEAEDFAVEIGAGRLIADMENGLQGKAVGEHRLDVTFPKDYHRAEMANKQALFTVQVKAISEPALPELNEEFFLQFGVKEGGMPAFRAEVKRNMERERDNAVRHRTKNNALEALHQANPLEIPKALIESESQRMLHEMQQRLQAQGVPAQHLQNMQPESFAEQAGKRVSLGLLVGEIVQSNNMRAEDAKVRAAVEQVAASYDDPSAVVRWYYEDPQRLSDVQVAVLEDQAVDWVLSQAKVSEQLIGFSELMKPQS